MKQIGILIAILALLLCVVSFMSGCASTLSDKYVYTEYGCVELETGKYVETERCYD